MYLKNPYDCSKLYNGENSRPLVISIKVHQNYKRNKEFYKLKTCQHAWEHRLQFRNTSILREEKNNSLRKIREAALNFDDSCVESTSVEFIAHGYR